ncbi:MAG: hypothetical protein ACR2LS_01735 [Thermomicrobiales bacterium]
MSIDPNRDHQRSGVKSDEPGQRTVDDGLEALRRLWRNGFHDRIALAMAHAALSRMRPMAATSA